MNETGFGRIFPPLPPAYDRIKEAVWPQLHELKTLDAKERLSESEKERAKQLVQQIGSRVFDLTNAEITRFNKGVKKKVDAKEIKRFERAFGHVPTDIDENQRTVRQQCLQNTIAQMLIFSELGEGRVGRLDMASNHVVPVIQIAGKRHVLEYTQHGATRMDFRHYISEGFKARHDENHPLNQGEQALEKARQHVQNHHIPYQGGISDIGAMAHENLAIQLATWGKYPEAIHHFERGHNQEAMSPSHLYVWGHALHAIGKNKQALEKLSVVRQRSAFPSALATYGFVLAKMGRHTEAIEKFKEAIEMNPKHPHSYVYWANSLNEMGRKADAYNMLKKVQTLIPDDDEQLKKFTTRLKYRIEKN